jgi:tetratricopeptide (TPR) repeat protein
VIAINPQSTLNPALVPWEDRYPEGKAQDWLGDFADGATGAACASSVLVAYDPLFALDRRHVERLSPGNLVELKTPLLRHSLPSWLVEMGVLKEVVTRFAEGGLDNADCRALARKRRTIPRYYASMMVRTRSRAVARRCLDLLLDKPHLGTEARYDIILALRAHEMWTDAACVCLTLAERGAAFSVELACGIAQQLMERSNFALASELAHAALRRAPASLEGQVILAEVPYRSGDLATAAELTRKVILNHPQSGRPHRLLARIHWAAGRAGRAAASAADAVRFDPDNYLGHYERGVYLLALGRIESAAEALRMALAIQPTNRAAAEKLAACEARLAA